MNGKIRIYLGIQFSRSYLRAVRVLRMMDRGLFSYYDEMERGGYENTSATWLFEPLQGKALTKAGCRNRLLSFFHCREKPGQLKGYIKRGVNENLPSRIDRK